MQVLQTKENSDVRDRYQTIQNGAQEGRDLAKSGYASLDANDNNGDMRRQVVKRPSQGTSVNTTTTSF